MKSVLLVGVGRFGKSVAMKLNELGHEVMAIDKHEDRINDILPFVTDAQIGDSTKIAFLRTLGVANYDLCIVSIVDDFQSSLETTSLLKELGAKKIIARAGDEIHRKFLLNNGADEVVFPEKQVAEWTAIRYTTDHVIDFIALDSEYAIYEVSVPEQWVGKSVAELDIRKKHDINILAIRDSDRHSATVSGDTVFGDTQTLLILGKWKNIKKIFKS